MSWKKLADEQPPKNKLLFVLLKTGGIEVAEFEGEIDFKPVFASIYEWIDFEDVKYWQLIQLPEIP